MKLLKNIKNSYSIAVVVLCAVFIISTRVSVIHDKEISWDVLGYYMYLPATFVHDDFMLTDISWLENVSKEKDLSSTLYFVSTNKKGDPMYFFLMGMSLLYLPWFLIGHACAFLFDYPPDGFSMPYVYALIAGAVFYTLAGLWFFRKILTHYFSDRLSAILLFIIYFGTNTVHHLIAKDLETVNVLFTLGAIVLWYTIKWHEKPTRKRLLIIAVSIALMTLIKPSEILIGLLPLLYGVSGKAALLDKLNLLKDNVLDLGLAILLGLVILSPQLIYWKVSTGHFIYDSYNNPGVGLDWWSPHIKEVLFSFKKGWLVYTPVMILGLLGFVQFYKKNKSLFLGAAVYFLISFFLISSWTEWWYGSSFSCRPVITLYIILAISMGYALQLGWSQSKPFKSILVIFVVGSVVMNQFQWWQFRNWILHDYRMTEEYYLKHVFSTSIEKEDLQLLEFDHGFFSVNKSLTPPILFKQELVSLAFTNEEKINDPGHVLQDHTGKFHRIASGEEFGLGKNQPLKEFTYAKFFYLECELTFRYPVVVPETPTNFVNAISRSNGVYGYGAEPLTADSVNVWTTQKFRYVAPRIRSYNDIWMTQFWNRDKQPFDIKDIKITQVVIDSK